MNNRLKSTRRIVPATGYDHAEKTTGQYVGPIVAWDIYVQYAPDGSIMRTVATPIVSGRIDNPETLQVNRLTLRVG